MTTTPHRRSVDDLFGLTRASYFVWPRVLMERMPAEWQDRFVELVDEYYETWNDRADKLYDVRLRDERGRYLRDDLADYRHPSLETIATYRRDEPTSQEEATP